MATMYSDPSPAVHTWMGVRPLLRPALRRSTFLRDVTPPRLRRPSSLLSDQLDELVAIDLHGLVNFPPDTILDEWCITEDEVFDVAWQNLAATAGTKMLSSGNISRVGDDNDNYSPSLLQVPGWLAAVTRSYRHRPVAFIPDPTTLLVVDADPTLLVQARKETHRRYSEAALPMSERGFTLDPDGLAVEFE
ncbi:hypothetical protein OH799_33440 [Nocardia sp. NBC_00881]|uniref:hypothetical protein n=1 Tax=Nocardia sp. NBC_00881 TaxID=2975995 RepID=UPI00386A7049|nr:hypothetical protein OH799_33440 [Nocardia sp. NBC_00881]